MTIHFVHKGNFPVLHECLDVISHDSGGGSHDRYVVPEQYLERLEGFEKTAKELSDTDRTNFCIGEMNEMRAIQDRTPALGELGSFLEDFFDGFDSLTHQYEADERAKQNTPEAKAPAIAALAGKRHVDLPRRGNQMRFSKGLVMVAVVDTTGWSDSKKIEVADEWRDLERLPANVDFRI